QRFVRQSDDLTDDQEVVVRGGELDPEVLRTDALRNHSVYGTYAISVFALRDATLDELAQEPPLVRFATLTLMTVGAIRSTGLRLEATGRNPRHFSVALDDLDEGVACLCRCDHRTVANPYHEP
ncbi:MAG: hypothetical protein ACREA0_17765, partial [bacterium]